MGLPRRSKALLPKDWIKIRRFGSFSTTLALTTRAFNIKLTAETSVYTYTYNKDNVTFTPGKYYEVKVKMKRQPKTFNLSEVGGDITLMDGDLVKCSLTGESHKNKVSIADGATVTLSGADIYGMDYEDCKWAGITCEGDAIIVLKDNTLNAVKGFYKDYPGIFVPQGKALTIKGETEGTGWLDATSNGNAAGIGGGNLMDCGSIVIEGGSITAYGGKNAAGIGGGYYSRLTNEISVTDNVTELYVRRGEDAPYSIGIGKKWHQ